MPFVPIPGACQVNVKGYLNGQQYENVWYTECDAPPDLAQLNGIAAIFQANLAGLLNVLSQQLFINEIEVRYLGAAAGPVTNLFISPAQDGAVAENSVPNNVAFCMRLSTGLAGRRYRGRKYFGGLPVSSVSNNDWDFTSANSLATACADLMADLTANGTPLAVVSKTYQIVSPVTAIGYVDTTVDSQRRRLPGRGR